VVEAANKFMKEPTSVEEAIVSEPVDKAISLAIFKITGLQKPARAFKPLSGGAGASKGRLDWQDLYGKIVLKLTNPTVGFAATNFSPRFAYRVARNTAAEWLRSVVKERPRKEQIEQDETPNFQSMQFDPRFEPKEHREADNQPDTRGVKAMESVLDGCAYDFAAYALERFARMFPEDHAWLVEYKSNRRVKSHTNGDHQRAARLCRKLRDLYDQWEQEAEEDLTDESELELETT